MWTIETTLRALGLGVLLSCGACDPNATTDTGTAKPEPGKVDAGDKPAEPSKEAEAEPAKPEPVSVEPAKPEPAKPEPAQPYPAATVEPTDSPGSGRTAVPTLEDCLFGCDNAKMSEADTATCRARCKS